MSLGNLTLFLRMKTSPTEAVSLAKKMFNYLGMLDPEDEVTICDIEYNSPSDSASHSQRHESSATTL
jgi:hypothetical protein